MITVVQNQKGGVGKTTTAANLAVCLARRGGRVLCVDCDPQSTLTRQVGIDSRWLGLSLVDALAGRAGIRDVTVGGALAGVDVVPSSRDLVGVEMALVAELGRERFLRDALEPVAGCYEHMVIDTPPNLGLLTVNALVCAEVVLAPVSCEDEASVQGLVELRSTLAKLPRLGALTPGLACVLTRWVPRRLLAATIEQAVVELGVPVVGRVPARAAVGHAAARRMPLACASPDGAVSLSYERLAGRLGAVIAR